MIGEQIHDLAKKLWHIPRSITGEGVRQTLRIIKEVLPDLAIVEVPTGSKVFDWTVPPEWEIKSGYIITPDGGRICDFSVNNLHVIGYSESVDRVMDLSELQTHLYSIPEQPDAIPYVTSYYERRWGFCIKHSERLGLKEGSYRVVIDSRQFSGNLTYGEIIIKGKLEKEVLLSTYICHPSLANNELSGPCVTAFLAKTLLADRALKYSYRILFLPETIGAVTYIATNIETLKQRTYAGFVVTCIGDDRAYSYLPSRLGNTISDRVAKHVLRHIDRNFKEYTWNNRGSDERQYCSPGVDLPVASIMRTKYGEYPEYHTSLDDLVTVVTPSGLQGGYSALLSALHALERDCYPVATIICEPQLGKRGLYRNLSTKAGDPDGRKMIDLLSWSDGHHSLLEIAELTDRPISTYYPILKLLEGEGLLKVYDERGI